MLASYTINSCFLEKQKKERRKKARQRKRQKEEVIFWHFRIFVRNNKSEGKWRRKMTFWPFPHFFIIRTCLSGEFSIKSFSDRERLLLFIALLKKGTPLSFQRGRVVSQLFSLRLRLLRAMPPLCGQGSTPLVIALHSINSASYPGAQHLFSSRLSSS